MYLLGLTSFAFFAFIVAVTLVLPNLSDNANLREWMVFFALGAAAALMAAIGFGRRLATGVFTNVSIFGMIQSVVMVMCLTACVLVIRFL